MERTYSVEVPPAVVGLADRRCKDIANSCLVMWDLPRLILSCYLQGLEDGFNAGEKAAKKELTAKQ